MSDAAGNIQIVLSVNKATYTQAMQEAQKQLDTFAGKAKAAGHGTATGMQAASASIRLMEGDITRNVRAVEKFISTIPGVGNALKAIFPAVGALATVGLFAKMGDEVYKFIKQVNEVPKELQNSFQQMATSQESANDALAVTNDRLEMEIAKLEHKPANGLKLALDESRQEADKLATSLESASDKMRSLLNEHQISTLGAILTGKAGTGEVTKQITTFDRQIADLAYQYQQAVRAGNVSLAATLKGRLNAKTDEETQYATSDAASREVNQKQVGAYDQTANIEIEHAVVLRNQNEQDAEQLEARNKLDSQRKAADELRIANSRAAAEADRTLQEQTIARWHSQLEDLKATQDTSLSQEADFWIDRATTVKEGSKAYQTALDEANKSIATIRAENLRAVDAFNKEAGQPMEQTDLGKSDQPWIKDQGHMAAEYLRSLNEGVVLQQRNAEALDQASLKQDEATGRISRYGAAVAEANLHTEEYQRQLKALQDALQAVKDDPTMSSTAKKAATADLNNQVAALNGSYDIQSMQDKQNISSQTLGGQFRDALNEFVTASQDMASKLRSVLSNTLDSLNNDILSGKGFKKTGADALRGVGKVGLEKAEGTLLSSFKLGTRGNPMYTKSVDALGGVGAGGSGGGDDSDSSSGGGLKGFLGSLISGAFADGGDPTVGRPALVGEEGPELFVPHTAGTIIPNKQLSGTGGNKVVHNHYIDARGAQNPAHTVAALHQAVQQMAPQIAASSVKAMHEHQARRPSTARR